MESPDLDLLENIDMKMAAVDALDELMEQAPFDKISVSRLCETAGISRATFYRHFKDKFAIVQWYTKFLHSKGTSQIGRTLSWYEGFYISEFGVAQRISFFKNAAKSNDRNSLDRFIPRYRRKVLTETLTDYYNFKMDDHLRFLVRASIEMEIHMFPSWHYGKLDCTLEQACKWAAECVPRELFDMLNAPLEPRDALTPRMLNARIGPNAASNPNGHRRADFTAKHPAH